MSEGYARWAQLQAQGVANARPYTDARRLSGQTLADVRRRNRERHPCKVKGCTRTAHKGALCKGHWDMVPLEDRLALQVDVMTTAHKVAAKHHRRFLRVVQARVAQ